MRANQSYRIALAGLAAALLAACGSAPVEHRAPRSVAIIMSGDVVSYNAYGLGSRVHVVEVDGNPVKAPQGPVELAPGRHTVTLTCDGARATQATTVAAGEVYQFMARKVSGTKGCVGRLSRVRSINP